MYGALFRGKRKDNGKWAYGYFVYAKSDFDSEEFREADIIPHDTDRVYKGEYNVVYPCVPETIGQYTGKDLNGEKLFDGDIVETVEDYDDTFGHPATTQFYSVVVFDEENFCWAFKTGNDLVPFNDWTWECCFKVGNIFDNPELLEVQ